MMLIDALSKSRKHDVQNACKRIIVQAQNDDECRVLAKLYALLLAIELDKLESLIDEQLDK
jgi:hypothetical protein